MQSIVSLTFKKVIFALIDSKNYTIESLKLNLIIKDFQFLKINAKKCIV
jgi:hypothetical protein